MPQLRMQVGASATRSSDSIMTITRDVDDTVAGNGHGFSDSSHVDRSGGAVAYASFDSRILVAGSQNYDHFAGFQAGASIGTSGTTTKHYGLVTILEVTAGVVTNAYDVYGFDPTGAGVITNNYGIYMPDKTKGTTLNYAIYTNLGLVRFGDVTLIEKNSNTSFVGLRVKNNTNGTAATAQISLQNDQAANAFGIAQTSSGYTPAGLLVADGTYMFSQRPGGMAIVAEHASGTVRIGANNTEVARHDKPATATYTGLMLWDVDSGTLRRVKVGAGSLANALAFV
jgi:hypothetical protein